MHRTEFARKLYWEKATWISGAKATNDASVYSFDVLDRLVALAQAAFPSLTDITITGAPLNWILLTAAAHFDCSPGQLLSFKLHLPLKEVAHLGACVFDPASH